MSAVKRFFEKHNNKIIIFTTCILFIFAILNLVYPLEINVTSNDECLWVNKKVTPDSAIVVFSFVKVKGVAWKAGIRNGDELIEVNHVQAVNTAILQNELNKFNAGEFAPYKVKKKNGEILNTKVEIKKLISFPQLAMGLLGLIWLVIGFIVLMAKPDGKIQKLFYRIGAAMVASVTVLLFNVALPLYIAGPLDLIWSYAACFLPFLFVKFFWSFPKPTGFIEKKWVRRILFYTPLTIFIISYLIRVFFIYGSTEGNHFYPAFIGFLLFLFISAAITSFFALIISYTKIKNKEERKPHFIILATYALCLASFIYTIIIAPAISDTIFNSPEYYTPVILIALLPVSFGYSIFRYQLMDVSAVIKNTIIYGAATISIAIVYFLIIYLLGQSISSAIGTQYQGLIAGTVFIVFAVVFQSSKDKFQDFLTARFYPEQFAHQRILMGFTNDLATYVGLETILDSMKKTFVHALKIEQFGILIKNEKTGAYHLERSEGISRLNLEVHPAGIMDFINAKYKVEKIPVIGREDFASVFPDDSEQLKAENIYTIIPMVVKSKVIGLVMFGLKYSGSQFGGKDLELLYAATSQAAISIENARLYKSESEKLKIERDLDLARKIQEGLLPKSVPQISGLDIAGQMVPAMQVGGDYYDLIPVSKEKIFVVVGDVSGKGLSAALYMTKLQTMVQLACTIGRTPKEVLVDINKRMYESMERNWFVTMTLALFDMESGTVKFCRAGHAPVLVSQNGEVELHQAPGIGVGLEKGPIFERTLVEKELKLSPGQVFTFFSDGITEAMNENQDLYGDENLIEFLKINSAAQSSEILHGIWNELITYRGSAEQNDDMTMVVVRVGERTNNS